MSSSNDNPLKQFAAFWFVLALSLIFVVLALVFAPMFNRDDITAADKANAERRIAIREAVESEQAANLSFKESGESAQLPPSRIFQSMAAKLVSSKPVSVKEERHRDPAVVAAEAAAAAASEEAQEPSESEESAN